MQKRLSQKGQPRAVTGDLFRKAMLRHVLPRIREVVNTHPAVFPNGMADVKLCLDKAPIHQKALSDGLLSGMGLRDNQAVQHPPWSCDFQTPVEWSLGTLKNATRAYVADHGGVSSATDVQKVMKRIFMGDIKIGGKAQITADGIKGAFDKLAANYLGVMESRGGYGKKRDM